MQLNILSAQTFNSLRAAIEPHHAGVEPVAHCLDVPEKMVVRHFPTEPLPQQLYRIHVRGVFGEEKQVYPLVSGKEFRDTPAFVPKCVVEYKKKRASRIFFQQSVQKGLKVPGVDPLGEAMMNLSSNRIHRSEDVNLEMPSGPGRDMSLFAPHPPCTGKRRCQLSGHFVQKQQVQAFEVAGAAQQNFQRSFFLARSTWSFPGKARVGRRRRQPIL